MTIVVRAFFVILAAAFAIHPAFAQSCAQFPAGVVPFTAVNYISNPNADGDRLVVGTMPISTLQQIPLPSFANQRFCGTVEIAAGITVDAYVPTPAERQGDFSAFSPVFLDPASGAPFTGGIIPANRLGGVFAWRVVSVRANALPYLVANRGLSSFALGSPLGTLSTGFVTVQPTTGAPTTYGLEYLRFGTNQEAALAATPAVQSGRIFAEFDTGLGVGVSFANASSQSASVNYTFTDTSGNTAATGALTIPPNGQVARFLNDIAPNLGSTFRGTMTFSSLTSIAASALRLLFSGSFFGFTFDPVFDAAATSAIPITIPHIVNGVLGSTDSYVTHFYLVNPINETIAGTIQFLSSSGTALALPVDGQNASSVAYSLPARASRRIDTSASGTSLVTGSARIVPSANNKSPGAFAIVDYINNGQLLSHFVVSGMPAGQAFRLHTQMTSQILTGVAIANTSANTVTATVDLLSLTGATVGSSTMSIAASGQVAKLFDELFPSIAKPFEGTARVYASSSSLAVVGLRFNGISTTGVPAADESTILSGNTYFPHIAIGGGYSAQLALMGASSAFASGTLGFTQSSGQTFAVTAALPPVLSSISTSSFPAGAATSATITGTNLIGASAVNLTGTGVSATISGTATQTSLPVSIVVDSTVSTATRSLTVLTAGGTSNALSVTIYGKPSITGISVAGGDPGQTISAAITGKNLTGASQVTFDGTGVTGTIGSGATDTSLPVTITIAANAGPGTRTITVTTPSGSASYLGFVVSGAAPIINDPSGSPAGLSQTIAPLYGGPFTLTVNGLNFGQSSVVMAGSSSLATTFVNATQLQALVRTSVLATPGIAVVTVVNSGGIASNAVNMKVVERGDINGNRAVNIGDALVTALTVGGVNKPPLPVQAGDINLNGTTNIGDALVLALFSGRLLTNLPSPTIASISPSAANRGDTLTITGTGFSSTAASNAVLFTTSAGTIRATPATATSTSLTVAVPQDAVSGVIQLYRLDVPLGGGEFPFVISGTSTPLLLTSVTTPSNQVPVGTSIVLNGSGFDLVAANNTVSFRSESGTVGATVAAATGTSLTVTVPQQAVCGGVSVTTGGQTTRKKVVQISGTACGLQLVDILGGGAPGDTLVLEGTAFDPVTPANNVVKFTVAGGTVIAPVLQSGGTQIHVRIPDSAIEGPVTVTLGSQTSAALTYKPSS